MEDQQSTFTLLIIHRDPRVLATISDKLISQHNISHIAVVGSIQNPNQLLSSVYHAGVCNIEELLFVQSLHADPQEGNQAEDGQSILLLPFFQQYTTSHGIFSIHQLACKTPIEDMTSCFQASSTRLANSTIHSVLLTCGASGLLPRPTAGSFLLNDLEHSSSTAFIHLDQVPFIVRPATIHDAAAIFHLQSYLTPTLLPHRLSIADIEETLHSSSDENGKESARWKWVAEVDGRLLAVLLLKQCIDSNPEKRGISLKFDFVAVHPSLEERAEILCALCYFMLQCLLGDSRVLELHQGNLSLIKTYANAGTIADDKDTLVARFVTSPSAHTEYTCHQRAAIFSSNDITTLDELIALLAKEVSALTPHSFSFLSSPVFEEMNQSDNALSTTLVVQESPSLWDKKQVHQIMPANNRGSHMDIIPEMSKRSSLESYQEDPMLNAEDSIILRSLQQMDRRSTGSNNNSTVTNIVEEVRRITQTLDFKGTSTYCLASASVVALLCMFSSLPSIIIITTHDIIFNMQAQMVMLPMTSSILSQISAKSTSLVNTLTLISSPHLLHWGTPAWIPWTCSNLRQSSRMHSTLPCHPLCCSITRPSMHSPRTS